MAKHKYTPEEIAEWRKTHGSNFFYFNKDDSNFMVPKPYGFGRTSNWAHPVSWVMGAAVIALIVYFLFFRQPAA
jgi:uncharacterized membrane protein